MKTIARCVDSGLVCDFEAAGTEREVLDLLLRHVESAHGMDENPAELAERIFLASRLRLRAQGEPDTTGRKAA